MSKVNQHPLGNSTLQAPGYWFSPLFTNSPISVMFNAVTGVGWKFFVSASKTHLIQYLLLLLKHFFVLFVLPCYYYQLIGMHKLHIISNQLLELFELFPVLILVVNSSGMSLYRNIIIQLIHSAIYFIAFKKGSHGCIWTPASFHKIIVI